MQLKVGDKIKVTRGTSISFYTIVQVSKMKAFGEEDEFGRLAEFDVNYDSTGKITPYGKWYIMDDTKREIVR